MARRPWMPMYWGDYLADTAHFSAAEHGAYLLLIAFYWTKGGLPDNDEQLARITKLSTKQWRKAKPTLQEFFIDGWKHKRIEFELTESERISAAGRTGGKASAEARRKAKSLNNNCHTSTTVQQPLNDYTNDLSTIGQALQPQPQSQEKKVSKSALRASKKIPLPIDWQPPSRAIEIAKELRLEIAPIEARFRDYLTSTGKQYVEYDAAFCNFVRNAPKFNGDGNGRGRSGAFCDDSRSSTQAADRLIKQAKAGEFTFGPRPGISTEPSATNVRLLSKG